jgi:ankyrin repeat protein
MDFFNNSIGIDFVKANQHLTNDQLANSIEDLVDLGKAKKILDGKLINSTKEKKRNLNIFESIIEKALSLIGKLIATSGASRNKDGMTPLIFASNLGEIETLKLIIEYSDIEGVDDYGETAIFHAARLKTSDIGVFLLNNKANPSTVNTQNGNTALMEAVQYKNIELAKSLIEFGADINLKDHHGFSAYDIAVQEEVENEFSFLKPS